MENRDVFFYSRVLFWGFGLSLIINITGTSFWIAEILGTIMSFIILSCVKKKKKSGFFKKISGIIFAFLAAIIIANMGGTMYLKETPNSILTFVPLVVGLIVGKSDDSAYKKIIHILFVFTMFMFAVSGSILINNAKMENLLPLSFDIKRVLLGAAIFTLTSITPILCLNDFEDKKSMLVNYATSNVTVLFMSFLVVSVLGTEEAMLFRYPEFVLLKRIKIFDFFSNVENLFVIMIVNDFVSTIAAGFKNIDAKGKVWPIITLLFLIGISTYACNHTSIMTLIYKFYPIGLVVLLLPTLIPKR